MPLGPGTRVGPYDIVSALGAGGMGEVYRARDTRLQRDVAIKILPAAVTSDPDRLARFEREAQVLASLNHPNIAAIYHLERTGDSPALVMELVEGETLADRIARGPIPVDEALPIAKQIADALEAAHEQGIIHRDLKPANIKLTSNGNVKVLDFGLAKLNDPNVSNAPNAPNVPNVLSMSPTIASPALMTGVGVLLGTAAYMAPEQAKARPADKRSDVWAFGCVLFEMLTGRRAFEGDDISETIAAILRGEPDWSALSDQVPLYIRRVLRRCLQKDPARRLHHIADARVELEDGSSEATLAAQVAPTRTDARSTLWRRALPWTVASLALTLVAWTLWDRSGSSGPAGQPVLKLEINLPAGVELYTATVRSIAVSPDGTRIAFVGVRGGGRQLYIRPLGDFEAEPVRGTDTASSCFFSPDGKSIGLVTPTGELRTVSLADGLATTVTEGASPLVGAAWAADDRLVFGRDGALWQISRSGGTSQPLTKLGGPRRDTLHALPAMLPGGRTMLFGALSDNQWRVEALVLATGERRTIVERGTLPLYTASGHLVFFRERELLVAPFDAAAVKLTGPVVRALDNLPVDLSYAAPIVDVSSSGTIAFAPTSAVSRLVSVSRQGAEQPLNETLRPYTNPRVSPDGSRILVEAGPLWIQEVARSTFTRIASRGDVVAGFPIWAPDGHRVIYRASDGLHVQDVDGSNQSELIAGTTQFDFPASITPDGETLVLMRGSQEGVFDIFAGPLRAGRDIRPVLNTAAYEGGARLSPDGHWLTYVSNESGRNEVYLRPFPGPGRRWQVSTDGGTQAIWNPNGKEIFYRDGNKMMVVELSTTAVAVLAPPRLLFEQSYAFGSGITIPNYDVTRDGQRFIMVKDESTAARLSVVLNWQAALGARDGR